MKQAYKRSRSVKLEREQSSRTSRLTVQIKSSRNPDPHARISVVAGSRFRRGYVWIGDDDRFYGWLPVSRLLALADAIRGEDAR